MPPRGSVNPRAALLSSMIGHDIVQAHRGDTRIESTVGVGTDVIVTLPRFDAAV